MLREYSRKCISSSYSSEQATSQAKNDSRKLEGIVASGIGTSMDGSLGFIGTPAALASIAEAVYRFPSPLLCGFLLKYCSSDLTAIFKSILLSSVSTKNGSKSVASMREASTEAVATLHTELDSLAILPLCGGGSGSGCSSIENRAVDEVGKKIMHESTGVLR